MRIGDEDKIPATGASQLDSEAAAAMHNRLVVEIVEKIVEAPIAGGGTMSDVMTLCESVIVGVMLRCFGIGVDVKVLDAVVGRVKERLALARLETIETAGSS